MEICEVAYDKAAQDAQEEFKESQDEFRDGFWVNHGNDDDDDDDDNDDDDVTSSQDDAFDSVCEKADGGTMLCDLLWGEVDNRDEEFSAGLLGNLAAWRDMHDNSSSEHPHFVRSMRSLQPGGLMVRLDQPKEKRLKHYPGPRLR